MSSGMRRQLNPAIDRQLTLRVCVLQAIAFEKERRVLQNRFSLPEPMQNFQFAEICRKAGAARLNSRVFSCCAS